MQIFLENSYVNSYTCLMCAINLKIILPVEKPLGLDRFHLNESRIDAWLQNGSLCSRKICKFNHISWDVFGALIIIEEIEIIIADKRRWELRSESLHASFLVNVNYHAAFKREQELPETARVNVSYCNDWILPVPRAQRKLSANSHRNLNQFKVDARVHESR